MNSNRPAVNGLKRAPKIGLWSGCIVIVAAAALVTLLVSNHPARRFASAVISIAEDSTARVGDSVNISTYLDDQPLIGSAVTSADIERRVVEAFGILSAKLTVKSITYFSPTGDMPTQETIWQYPSYFVRLYVTSSLDCDGASIEVREGSYRDFRGDR
ncbi:MAG: hypothetical protein EOP86_25415, partial [Verrucomicrobiaceae bacterium]